MAIELDLPRTLLILTVTCATAVGCDPTPIGDGKQPAETSTGDGDGDPSTGDGDGEPGDGDGDPSTGDGDGEPGDGDGEPGDGDGDPSTGDGDGEPIVHEMPCPDPAREHPDFAELCPPERQIIQVAGDCPPVDPNSSWTVENLFASAPVPPPLSGYCRYIWTDTNNPADLGTLPLAVQGLSTPDCRVFPQSPLDSTVGDAFADAFAQGVQRVPNAEQALGLGLPIDIAVVDTAPSETGLGQSIHGPTMAAIAASVAGGCAPGIDKLQCRRSAKTWLGLPQVAGEGPNTEVGGFYGYQTDLAEGIVAAIYGWTNHDHKLILNLSVGWEPSLGDLDDAGVAPTAAIAAVRDAIALGHCQGALTIAASGNQPDGACVGEATGPGNWERLPGWDPAQCQTLGLSLDEISLDPTLPYHPFLHAATPVDWDLENLADFRPQSNARIAALGFGGLVELAATDYGPLMGSSVSTATVTGIAALVWSYFPTLAADEVMDVIHASGTPRVVDNTVVAADLFLGGVAPNQHMVTACEAITWACQNLINGPSQSECAAVINQCTGAYPTPSIAVDAQAWWTDFNAGFSQLPPTDKDAEPAPVWSVFECERCGLGTLSRLPDDESILADAMGDPWVLPQPATPPCPMCVIDDDEIYLSVDNAYANMVIDNVIVSLYDAIGGAEYNSYGRLTLVPTRYLVVTDPDVQIVDRSGLPPRTARVTMVFTDYNNPAGPTRVVAANEIPVF